MPAIEVRVDELKAAIADAETDREWLDIANEIDELMDKLYEKEGRYV